MARQRIMNEATVLFAERGYGSVGINEVGQTAGFGKGALYYHIRSKEDLLLSIVTEKMEQLISASDGALCDAASVEARIDGLTTAFVHELVNGPEAMTVCYRDVHAFVEPDNAAAVQDLQQRYRAIWAEAFSVGAAAGEHRDLSQTEVDAFIGMLFAAVFWMKPSAKAADLKAAFSHTIAAAVAR